VVAAVAATWGPMTDGARVEAAPRLAQWRVDALPCYTYRKSLPFRIGLWNWSVIPDTPAPLLSPRRFVTACSELLCFVTWLPPCRLMQKLATSGMASYDAVAALRFI